MCISHVQETHVTFTDYVRRNSSNLVWRKTLSYIIYNFIYIIFNNFTKTTLFWIWYRLCSHCFRFFSSQFTHSLGQKDKSNVKTIYFQKIWGFKKKMGSYVFSPWTKTHFHFTPMNYLPYYFNPMNYHFVPKTPFRQSMALIQMVYPSLYPHELQRIITLTIWVNAFDW
jgi:hypothetical protein